MPPTRHRRGFIARPWVAMAMAMALVTMTAVGCSSSDEGADTDSTVDTTAATSTSAVTSPEGTGAATDLTLDPAHDYGDKYADGILPVGDGKFVTDGPEKGSIYLCHAGGGGGGGAGQRGPWFVDDNTEYDINAKAHVQGAVEWDGQYSVEIDGDRRIVTTNDVPNDHTTGEFPVQSDDPAYQYDRNPNHIEEQNLVYDLTLAPTLLAAPSCMGGESGVMTSGVALFNGFDAGNRDAGAWEVQDSCGGHPQNTSEYHYHTLSSCIGAVDVDTVIGFALDGLPITGPRVGDGNVLTTDDLDECHGISSTIELDGVEVTTYHYVMTQDFPYSVSCFRAEPARAPGLPGPPG